MSIKRLFVPILVGLLLALGVCQALAAGEGLRGNVIATQVTTKEITLKCWRECDDGCQGKTKFWTGVMWTPPDVTCDPRKDWDKLVNAFPDKYVWMPAGITTTQYYTIDWANVDMPPPPPGARFCMQFSVKFNYPDQPAYIFGAWSSRVLPHYKTFLPLMRRGP